MKVKNDADGIADEVVDLNASCTLLFCFESCCADCFLLYAIFTITIYFECKNIQSQQNLYVHICKNWKHLSPL